MLKYRIIYGTLLILVFLALIIGGGQLDGSLTSDPDDDHPVRGLIVSIMAIGMISAASVELTRLASYKKVRVLTFTTAVSSSLLALSWFLFQFEWFDASLYLALIPALTLLLMFLLHYRKYGYQDILINCGVSCLAVFYLGFMAAFCVGIRVDFGMWPFLMYVLVVKAADIGAYTAGKALGKHKFSPVISPGKTWEGMAGAAAVSVIVSVGFSQLYDIMGLWSALLFGICFSFIGQLGDLTESLIKRDADQKDSSRTVPGFGGVLDILDSPLAAAPFVYLFFRIAVLEH